MAAALSLASAALAQGATAVRQLASPALAVKAGRQRGLSVLEKRRQEEQQEMAAAEAAAAKRKKSEMNCALQTALAKSQSCVYIVSLYPYCTRSVDSAEGSRCYISPTRQGVK